MAQVTDYTVSNQTFPNTRADINNIFAAIATNNSGTSAPSNQQAGQWWIDTTSSTWVLYIHDGTDDIQFATIDTSANTVNFTDSALDVVTDTTPQLGGDLDLNSNDITGTGNINITGNITASGNLAGTLTTASQTNITSVGTLTGLTVNGNLSVDGGTIKLDGNYPVGTNNVALGNAALDDGSLSGGSNTAIGNSALTANTTGTDNIAVGAQSLLSNTIGSNNVGIGRDTIKANTTGVDNTGIGTYSLLNTTGSNNTGLGRDSLLLNTTGGNNVAVGRSALRNNTTASNNTAVGYQALEVNTTGTQNTAVGAEALSSNTTSDNNDAFGYATLSACTGSENAGFGRKSLQSLTTGLRNSGIGHFSGNSLTTGSYNTFLGDISGYLITTGSKNTIIGRYTGNQGGLDIRTSSNNIVLSDGDGNVRMYIDSSGNVLVGKTSADSGATVGTEILSGRVFLRRSGGAALIADRDGGGGEIVVFKEAGTKIGSINDRSNQLSIGSSDTGLEFNNANDRIQPFNMDTNNTRDDAIDLGGSAVRFDDIYATNGTIQTSDQNEKQSIQSLTTSEIAVAQRISKLFKTFKFNSSVEEKGDSARTHTGIIAQDVQQAFADEGLDAGNYALFISSTWWENEEGDIKEEATEGYTERTRLGIRYPELLSFVSSAFEQRLTNIETRLTALEGA